MKAISIIMGILLVIGGFYCMFTPGATFISLGLIVGILLLVGAAGSIGDYFSIKEGRSVFDLIWGILTGILGVIIIINSGAQFFTDAILVYLFAAWIVIGGITRTFASIKMKNLGSHKWGFLLVIGILFILLGIYSFMHPLVTAITIGYLIGFYVIFAGINLIGTALTALESK